MKFRDQFNNEKVEILLKQNQNDHVIDLIKSQKSLFISLYNLSQTKLTKLRRYIENALRKSWIRYFISSAEILILFVFKKNKELRLYVDYKDLNSVTIKNYHFLFLIIETLNRLSEAKAFTKLNLKNVYYRIRIRRDNEWKTVTIIIFFYFFYLFIKCMQPQAMIL